MTGDFFAGAFLEAPPLLLPDFLADLVEALLTVVFLVIFLVIFLGAAFRATAFFPAMALGPEITQIYSSGLPIIYSYLALDSATI